MAGADEGDVPVPDLSIMGQGDGRGGRTPPEGARRPTPRQSPRGCPRPSPRSPAPPSPPAPRRRRPAPSASPTTRPGPDHPAQGAPHPPRLGRRPGPPGHPVRGHRLGGAALPGGARHLHLRRRRAGNGVLIGHVSSLSHGNVFRDLDRVRPGDAMQVFSEERGFDYAVTEVKRVPRHDLSMFEPTTSASVTLITCTGDWLPDVQDYSERLVVRANLVAPCPRRPPRRRRRPPSPPRPQPSATPEPPHRGADRAPQPGAPHAGPVPPRRRSRHPRDGDGRRLAHAPPRSRRRRPPRRDGHRLPHHHGHPHAGQWPDVNARALPDGDRPRRPRRARPAPRPRRPWRDAAPGALLQRRRALAVHEDAVPPLEAEQRPEQLLVVARRRRVLPKTRSSASGRK